MKTTDTQPTKVNQEIEERVIAKIRHRRDCARKKYKCSMERTDLTLMDWLKHAQQEAMDQAIYLEKLIGIEQEKTNGQTFLDLEDPAQ